MSGPLSHYLEAVNAEAFLRSWLLPIVTTSPAARGVGSALWNPSAQVPMPLPYRAVRRISGAITTDGDSPLVRIHTFAKDYPTAMSEAAKTDARLLVLVNYPGWPTTIGGVVVHCDWIEITEGARHEPYGAENVVERFVSEVRLGLSLVSA